MFLRLPERFHLSVGFRKSVKIRSVSCSWYGSFQFDMDLDSVQAKPTSKFLWQKERRLIPYVLLVIHLDKRKSKSLLVPMLAF